jgi:hypothetical protein
MDHALFVLRTPGGHGLAPGMQGLAHAGDIAVAEDRPYADEILDLLPVHFHVLGGQPSHHGLRRGQA